MYNIQGYEVGIIAFKKYRKCIETVYYTDIWSSNFYENWILKLKITILVASHYYHNILLFKIKLGR